MAFFVSSSLLTRIQGDLKVCIRFVARRVFCQQPRRKHDTLLRMSFSHTLWLCARYISRFIMFDTALTQTATRRAHVATALLSPTLAFVGKAGQQSQEGWTAELGASAVQRWHSYRAGAHLCLDCQMAACTLSARVRHRTWLAACKCSKRMDCCPSRSSAGSHARLCQRNTTTSVSLRHQLELDCEQVGFCVLLHDCITSAGALHGKPLRCKRQYWAITAAPPATRGLQKWAYSTQAQPT